MRSGVKGIERLLRSIFLFPLCLLVFVIVMTILNVSGSSVGVYGVSAGQTPEESGLITGVVRPIRSDEWLVRTPWLMSQIHNGLPTQTKSGFGPVDAGVVGDLPTRSLDLLVRPHHVTSWFLPPDRALAAEWWIWHLLMMSGIYTFVIAISQHRGAGVLASFVLALSPSTQWWLAPGTFTTVGYGTLAGGLAVLAFQARGRRRQIGLSALAGWSAACMLSTLYVPWIITTTIVVSCAVLPVVGFRLWSATDPRWQFSTLVRVMSVMGAVFLVLIASYVVRHSEAIQAIGETVYPGQRTGERGGTLNPATVFGAPFDFLAYGPQTVNINGTNQSENSSGIVFALPVAVVFFGLLAAGKRLRESKEGLALTGLLAGSAILAAWAFLPLPAYVGRFVLLDRVPPGRLPPAISLVSALALGALVSYTHNNKVAVSKSVRVAAILVFSFVQLWAAGLYRVELNEVNPWRTILVILVLVIGWAFVTSSRWIVGAVILVAFGLVQTAHINPLQHGAEVLLDNPVSQLIKKVESSNAKDSGWLMLGGDVYVRGSIEATGVDFLSGISRYPNHEMWEKLDPTRQYADAWNRYAHLVVETGLPGSSPVISTPQADVVKVVIDPCDSRISTLGVTKIVTQDFVLSGCGALVGETTWGSRVIRVYSI